MTSSKEKGKGAKPLAFIVEYVRQVALHITRVAYGYLGNRDLFASLTVAQLCNVHNTAAGLCGFGNVSAKDAAGNARPVADVLGEIALVYVKMVAAAREWTKESAPRVAYVHQTWGPIKMPGGGSAPSAPKVAYDLYIKAGRIDPPLEWQAAVKAGIDAKVLVQGFRRGGFAIAVAADANREKALRPTATGTTQSEAQKLERIAALLGGETASAPDASDPVPDSAPSDPAAAAAPTSTLNLSNLL